MPIKFHCSHCQAPIKAPDTHAGHTLPCPKCGEPVLVAPEAPAPPTPPAPPEPAPLEPVLPTPPEPSEESVPEIVTHDPRQPTSAPPVATPPPEITSFEPPPTPTGGVVRDVSLTDVRVVDLKLPFGSVFKFAVQFFLCNLLLSLVVGLAVMLLAALLGAIGLSLVGSILQ
ncbi:hypothetical protein [Aeoliella sp.]|uniref:hypothetical protein n=1 Tax=Aeoliella sp. TaxID=2795800 RepID=UPI003CCBC350